jgi:hypothetical protein
MPGFNTLPAVGGGGGQANMTFVASVHMETYNRSWTQGGTAGYYALYSTNQENGYAYFVGSGVSTGVALNRVNNITHAFTRIDIIAPTNDMISLYKAKVKSTTVFSNPFDADPSIGKLALNSYPGIVTASGNFVLPNNALPLVNVLVCGAGGGAYHHSGGGGGGNVVKLTAIQAVGTTGVTIGAGAYGNGTKGGDTYFGNVYALGGGSGADTNNNSYSLTAGNGAGIGKQGTHTGTSQGFPGNSQTANTGLGTVGSPAHFGGNRGGGIVGSFSPNHGGGGGAGAGGVGTDRTSISMSATGGPGHQSDITGTNLYYGSGGGGSHHMSPAVDGSASTGRDWGWGANSLSNTANQHGGQGVVIVRYYIS